MGAITAADSRGWKAGDIKMLLKGTASDALYSVTYFSSDKSKQRTWGSLTGSGNVLEVQLPPQGWGTVQDKSTWVRTYPKSKGTSRSEQAAGAASGSGFFVAPAVVATNFHVV